MDCLRSFNFSTAQTIQYSGGNLKVWQNGVNYNWQIFASQSSQYNIQGYKNIDVYGIKVIGTVQTSTSIGEAGIVNDWGVNVLINGQIPLTNGFKTPSPDNWNLQDQSAFAKIFQLGKFSNEFKFGDPYKSVKSLNLIDIRAQGIQKELIVTPVILTLDYNLNFIVYYKFEGE